MSHDLVDSWLMKSGKFYLYRDTITRMTRIKQIFTDSVYLIYDGFITLPINYCSINRFTELYLQIR